MKSKPAAPDFSFFDLDPNTLDDAWLEQPKLMFQWSRKLADADAAVDEAKADLALAEAELDLAIRQDPEKYGLEKVTDKAIAAVILTEDDYITALSTYHQKRHKYAVLKAAVTALDHRRSALEGLVKLHGQSYFASPREDGNDTEGRERRIDKDKRSTRSKAIKKRE